MCICGLNLTVLSESKSASFPKTSHCSFSTRCQVHVSAGTRNNTVSIYGFITIWFYPACLKAEDVKWLLVSAGWCYNMLSSCVSGGPSQWPVGGTTDLHPEQLSATVSRRTAGSRLSESSEDHNSDASLHCSF